MTEAAVEAGTFTSERLVKLVTTGRSTGLPHVVMLRFVLDGGDLFVLAGKASSDWVRNSLSTGGVKLRLAGYSCAASVSIEKDTARVLRLYSEKYGSAMVRSWYAASEVCLRMAPSSPLVRRGVRGESEVKTDLKTWREGNSDYYQWVASAFDSASEEYDHTIRNNFINGWIRKRSIRELLAVARPDDFLLEIGCGTGAEALQISRSVAGVVATDISPSMIELVRRKVASRRDAKVIPLMLSAAQVARASVLLPGGRTRLAYSFNGALNCEPEIAKFPGELSRVLEDGGYFVCSIRNSLCLSEALVHGAVFQFDRMAPRKKQPTMVSVGGMDIPSYYYNPKKFTEFFSDRFRVRKVVALPAVLPPAYLSDLYFRARPVLSFLERVETAVAGSFPFNRFGDQTLLVFQKS